MSMNGSVMGDAVVTALEGVDGSMTDAQKAQLRTAWEAICGAIVAHITANAIVHPATMNNPAGQAVTVSTSTGIGATTLPSVIAGTGTVT